ncbi:MAG: right-handed parallel beta-helix repeat-containing protein [Candidatus Schekmanbacteria bacterium]|nr:right-handed parallel beta-helix repeat-containing protein [Candidatus Schekmanbacteria bacterium]
MRLKTLHFVHFFVALILLMLFINSTEAATRYVNGGCSLDGDGTSADCALTEGGAGARKTIQAAVDMAGGGDVVKVAAYSAYTVADTTTTTYYYENIIVTKEITLELYTGNGDVCTADCPATYKSNNPCLSDCKNWDIRPKHLPPASSKFLSSWIVINGDKNNDKKGDNGNATIAWSGGVGGTLRNFTVSGGYSSVSGGSGAGVLIGGEETSVAVSGLYVSNNDAGIAVRYGATPTITGCTISNNSRSGLVVRDGSAPIIGGVEDWNSLEANKIFANSQSMTGTECFAGGGYSECEQQRTEGCAAVTVMDSSSPKIWGNQIYSNKYTGIVSLGQSSPSIKTNIISKNGRTGLGMFSTGMSVEIIGNWIDDNERGIGIQSSGDPCNKIQIKNNDILNNDLSGLATCNAYSQIGGAAGEGNRIFNNDGYGMFISLDSQVQISNNNILNNTFSGIKLFKSEGTIEENLIADNGCAWATNNKCGALSSRVYGQIELDASVGERINHNIIVGGNYANGSFEGIGILAMESGVFRGVLAELREVKDNLIYRVGLGIKLDSNAGYGSDAAYRAGAVDRNLVMHWGSSSLDTDGTVDGYVLGAGNSPGENTYYYGQESGSFGAANYIFRDPDHETIAYSSGAVNPDFKLTFAADSPVYSLSDYCTAPPQDYLGAGRNFRFIEEERGATPLNPPTVPVLGRFDDQTGLGLNEVKLASYHLKANGYYNNMYLITYRNGAPATWSTITGYVKAGTIPNLATVSPAYTAQTHPVQNEQYIIVSGELGYRFTTQSLKNLTPAADAAAPVLTGLIPPDGAGGALCNQTIVMYLQDVGDGVDPNSVQVGLSGAGSGTCALGACAIDVGENSSYLKVILNPAPLLSANTEYTIIVSAEDRQTNNLYATGTFTTTTPCEGVDSDPTIENLKPASGANNVSVASTISFKVRDTGSGVNPDEIALAITDNGITTQVAPDKVALSDGNGSTPDYSVYYKPKSEDGFNQGLFGSGKSYSLLLQSRDYDDNIFTVSSSFTTVADVVLPQDVSYLRAETKGTNSIRLSWIPSENIDCDIAGFPYTLYIDSGSGYDAGRTLNGLASGEGSYTVGNLMEGAYNFKITVKDTAGNESAGAELKNVYLATSSDFADDFNGFYDDFASDLSKWDSPGADWSIAGGELQYSGASGQTSELITSNLERGDYNFQGKIKIAGGNAGWLLLRKTVGSQTAESGYLVRIGLGNTDNVGIYELSVTGMKTLEVGSTGSTIGTISTGTWYNFKVKIVSGVIKFYLGITPNPADILQVLAIDPDNTYWAGQIGLYQPAGGGSVLYDDLEVDYTSGSSIYRYTSSSSGYQHIAGNAPADLTKNVLQFNGGADTELLIGPLALADNYLYKIKFNIATGSAGIIVNKANDTAVKSSGYLIQVNPGVSDNVEFYALPAATPHKTGSYSISTGQDYEMWLIKRDSGYEVDMYNGSPTLILTANDVGNYAANNAAGIYTEASSQVTYDDIAISRQLSDIGQDTFITSNYTYSQIQSAIDNANTGDSVIFSTGTYALSGNTLKMKSGVNLKAQTIGACGAKTITVTGSGTLIQAANAASIEGFKLKGNTINVGILVRDVAPATIADNEIVSCYDAIRVGGGASGDVISAPDIQNNCIYGNSNNGISNSFESMAVIRSNDIYNNANNGIGINGQAAPQIRGNTIYNNQIGIGNRGQSYATIEQNNWIYSNSNQGIGIRDEAHPFIRNNRIYRNFTDGIGVGCPPSDPNCLSTANPLIDNNIIYSNFESGIALRSQVRPQSIAGNEIYNHIYSCAGANCEDSDHSFGAGIRFFDDVNPYLGQNNLHDNSYGISFRVNANNSFTLNGLSVTQNGIGLHIGGDSAITVENCIIYSNYKLGIGMYHNAHPLVRNNQIRYNGDAAGRAGEYLKYMSGAGTGVGGIGLAQETYPTITNNNIWGNKAAILLEDDTLDTQSGLALDEVRLGSLASSVKDDYKDRSLYLFIADGGDLGYNGGASQQVVSITAYNESTKVASISPAYTSRPAQGEHYRIFRENFGIGLRGCKRNDQSACSEAADSPGIPKIYNNQIHDNFLGVAIGGRDDVNGAPNPEVYNNTITSNGVTGCPGDFAYCGGGIGNRAHSSANLHHNTIRNSNNLNNYGIGVREAASPTIFANTITSNRIAVSFYSASGDITITSNSLINNGVYVPGRIRGGGIGLYEFAGNLTIDNNVIASNHGSGPGAGGIGIRQLNGGTINIGTTYGNTFRYNIGGQEAGELRCGGIGGRYDKPAGGTVTISKNTLFNNIAGGIGLDDFEYATFVVSGNTSHHNDKGIRVRNVADVTITNNSIYSNGDGTQGDPANNKLVDAGISLRRALTTPVFPAMDITITSNTIKGNHGDGISLADFQTGDTVTIQKNKIGGDVAGDGNDYWGINIGIFDETAFTGAVTIGSADPTLGNTIKYNRQSGMSISDVNDTVTIKNNNISYNGQADLAFPDGTQDASGIRSRNSTFGANKIVDNTISYNLYAGIAFKNSDGYINSGNEIFENGNLYELLPLYGRTICPNCEPAGPGGGPGSLTGDGGISVRDLALNKEVRIYDPLRTEIHDNHVGDIRVKPDNQGKVYLNDVEVIPVKVGGLITGVGLFFDCFEEADATTSIDDGGCNGTISGYGYGAKAGVNNSLANNDRFGIVVRGPYSQNLIIEGNIIENNMLTTNTNNVICSIDPPADKDHIGGGIALTCGARPIIRNNKVRKNGAELRPEDKGGHSGINLLNAGATQIYDNEIYSNKNDGIGLIDSQILSAPQIGIKTQAANKIYGNGRRGVGVWGAGSVSIANNQIYSNTGGGIGSQGTAGITIDYNQVRNNKDTAIGIKTFTGSVTISNNTITSNAGVNSPGGIGVSASANPIITISDNTTRNNTGMTQQNGISMGGFNGLASITVGPGNTIDDGLLFSTSPNQNLTIRYNTRLEQIGIKDFKDTVITSNTSITGGIACNGTTGSTLTVRNNSSITGIAPDRSTVGAQGTITMTDLTTATITNNTTIAGYGMAMTNCTDVYITSNTTISGQATGDDATGGIIAKNVANLNIRNNNSIANGIANRGEAGNKDMTITNNALIAGKASSSLYPGTEASILALTLRNLTINKSGSGSQQIKGYGIAFKDMTGTVNVQDNNLLSGNAHTVYTSLTNDGVVLGYTASGTTTIRNNTISVTDTALMSTSSGIGLRDITSATIARNTIKGVTGTAGSGYFGIELDGSATTSATITTNTIKYFKRSGLRAKQYSGTNMLYIRDNTINSCGLSNYRDGSAVRYASGVQLQDSKIAAVTGNTLQRNKYTGIALDNTDGTVGPSNIIRYNGGSVSCDGLQGPDLGDGGVAIRDLDAIDTVIVSNNTITDNYIGTVSRKDCVGTVRLNGTAISCGPFGAGYWDETQTKVYVDTTGVYVNNGTVTKVRNDQIVDCTADPNIPDIVSGGSVWGIAVVGGVQNAIVRNCNIRQNMTARNTFGPQGVSIGGGMLIGPNCSATIYSNTVYNNGFELASGSADKTIDSNTATEWINHPKDDVAPHWIIYDLASDKAVTQVEIFTSGIGGAGTRNWDVYLTTQAVGALRDATVLSDTYKVISNWAVGDTSSNYWDLSPTISGKTGRYLRISTNDASAIKSGHLLEVRYKTTGSFVRPVSPNGNGVFWACSEIESGNSGISLRCTARTELRNNTIYSNWNHGLESRGSIVKFGPGNKVYNQNNSWGIGVSDNTIFSAVNNQIYNNGKGFGMTMISGDVLIYSNTMYGNKEFGAVGLDRTIGNVRINVGKNQVYSQLKNALSFEINGAPDVLDLNIYSNNIYSNTLNGIRARGLDKANISIRNNTLKANTQFGIQFDDCGSTGGGESNISITNNLITSSKDAAMRFERTVANDVYIYSNILRYNNTTYATGTDEWGGIWFQETNNVRITKNDILSNNGIGIKFQDSTNIFIGWTGFDPSNASPPKYASAARSGTGAQCDGYYTNLINTGVMNKWEDSDLWDNVNQVRAAGKDGNIIKGNKGWGVQMLAETKNMTVNMQANVIYNNGLDTTGMMGGGIGIRSLNPYGVTATVYATRIGNHPSGDGVMTEGHNSVVYVKNTRSINGDSVQAKCGAHIEALDGCHVNDTVRTDAQPSGTVCDNGYKVATALIYNYNYVGCVNRCAGSSNKTGESYIEISKRNCIGGHVPADGPTDYDIHDHNRFEAGSVLESHEGACVRIWDGNEFVGGGSFRKNHSTGCFNFYGYDNPSCSGTSSPNKVYSTSVGMRGGLWCGNELYGTTLQSGDAPVQATNNKCMSGSCSVSTGYEGGISCNSPVSGNTNNGGTWSCDSYSPCGGNGTCQ